MQVTLEKIAVLDPVFDTFDAVGAFDEVGDPAPAEKTLLVRMHANILWILCTCISIYLYLSLHVYIYIYMQIRICIQYIYMCIYMYIWILKICINLYAHVM